MPTVVTITLSPCIDKSTSVPDIIADRKLKCAIPKIHPGGGGVNIARAMKKLGGSATAVYPAGGYTGKALNSLLAAEGVHTKVVPSANETRENIIVVEESSGKQYRFGMPGYTVTDTEYQEVLTILEAITEADFFVVSGSIPEHTNTGLFTSIAEIAIRKKASFVVDTSGEFLRLAIAASPFLIKPNLGELAALVGKSWLNTGEVLPAARMVMETSGCKNMVVSMGEAGALLVTPDHCWEFRPPLVERKSTVGAGDSMVAGIIYALSQGKPLPDAARYGVACGTAATLRPGTELCNKQDADSLFQAVSINVNPASYASEGLGL